MDNKLIKRYHLQNFLHSIILLAGMLILLGVIGWLVAGFLGILWSLASGLIFLIIASGISSQLILFLYGARPVLNNQLSLLNDIVDWLAVQSHLKQTPRLYYIPSRAMLAFSVGIQKDPAIAVSDGMLSALNSREILAVLAHEISHIHNKDLWVMVVADAISRITSVMALTGYIMVLFYLPFSIFQQQQIPWLLLILLMIAPNLSALMQLALSRTREFNADLQAVKLTSDPHGLISALSKIEHYQTQGFKQILLPGLRLPQPSLLRTHPLTEERIQRLLTMAQHRQHPFFNQQQMPPHRLPRSRRSPRIRINGLWH
ncbi:MAG: zinc metalloprotease HtpX [Gammaproteobacteria bacterium]|nr:zinc metalloprotease HtpX [Gammaproteobacteria bacterium]